MRAELRRTFGLGPLGLLLALVLGLVALVLGHLALTHFTEALSGSRVNVLLLLGALVELASAVLCPKAMSVLFEAVEVQHETF
ncbi:hypothetical protein [Deinococcus hohokamensis]|uniref:ABC transporter permease n=1 Tax=Deinococcus hohokamensis TaxID=309883 RepID=A0ABV9I4A5_9DEIO